MVNHTRNEHHYTVVIITWLIILGMNTIIQWGTYKVRNEIETKTKRNEAKSTK